MSRSRIPDENFFTTESVWAPETFLTIYPGERLHLLQVQSLAQDAELRGRCILEIWTQVTTLSEIRGMRLNWHVLLFATTKQEQLHAIFEASTLPLMTPPLTMGWCDAGITPLERRARLSELDHYLGHVQPGTPQIGFGLLWPEEGKVISQHLL